jgi:hypothetical protein
VIFYLMMHDDMMYCKGTLVQSGDVDKTETGRDTTLKQMNVSTVPRGFPERRPQSHECIVVEAQLGSASSNEGRLQEAFKHRVLFNSAADVGRIAYFRGALSVRLQVARLRCDRKKKTLPAVRSYLMHELLSPSGKSVWRLGYKQSYESTHVLVGYQDALPAQV